MALVGSLLNIKMIDMRFEINKTSFQDPSSSLYPSWYQPHFTKSFTKLYTYVCDHILL